MQARIGRFIAGAVALCLSMTALATDLTGKWSGQLTDPRGEKHEIGLNLKVDGEKVTGTMTGGPPAGAEEQIVDGRLQGDQLSFAVRVQGPDGNPVELAYRGKVEGNHIIGTHESPMGSLHWEATKNDAPRR
jgi:hypothetical protein